MPVNSNPDSLLLALDELEQALQANDERVAAMRARIQVIREQRLAGRPYREIVSEEQRPLIVELLSKSLRELERAGAQVRRNEARALHRDGMTMDSIASLFGVTRQRVSALLRDRDAVS